MGFGMSLNWLVSDTTTRSGNTGWVEDGLRMGLFQDGFRPISYTSGEGALPVSLVSSAGADRRGSVPGYIGALKHWYQSPASEA